MAQLRAFQVSMLKGAAGDEEWHTLVAPDLRDRLSKGEIKRQLYVLSAIIAISSKGKISVDDDHFSFFFSHLGLFSSL